MTQMCCFASEAFSWFVFKSAAETEKEQEKMAGKVVGRVFNILVKVFKVKISIWNVQHKWFDQINKYSSHAEAFITTLPLILSRSGLFTKK